MLCWYNGSVLSRRRYRHEMDRQTEDEKFGMRGGEGWRKDCDWRDSVRQKLRSLMVIQDSVGKIQESLI